MYILDSRFAGVIIGADSNETTTASDGYLIAAAITARCGASNSAVIAPAQTSADIYYALVFRTNGIYFFMKGGSLSSWTFYGSWGTDGTATPPDPANRAGSQ